MTDETLKQMMTEILDRLGKHENEGSDFLSQIFIILKGNGKPEEGMVWKVNELYKWMGEHQNEHAAQDKSIKDNKSRKEARQWDIYRGIIMWVLPAIVMWLANIIVNAN